MGGPPAAAAELAPELDVADAPQDAVITATAAAPLASRARFRKERRLRDAAACGWL